MVLKRAAAAAAAAGNGSDSSTLPKQQQQQQQLLGDAEVLLLQCLDASCAALGADHPNSLSCVRALVRVYASVSRKCDRNCNDMHSYALLKMPEAAAELVAGAAEAIESARGFECERFACVLPRSVSTFLNSIK